MLNFYNVFFKLKTCFEKSFHYLECHRLIHLLTTSITDKYRTEISFLKSSKALFCYLLHLICKFIDIMNIRHVLGNFSFAVFYNISIRGVMKDKINTFILQFFHSNTSIIEFYINFRECFMFEVKSIFCYGDSIWIDIKCYKVSIK